MTTTTLVHRSRFDPRGFAEIPGFDGVWANAATVEACRSELREVLKADPNRLMHWSERILDAQNLEDLWH